MTAYRNKLQPKRERTLVIQVKNSLAHKIKAEHVREVINEWIRMENGTLEIKIKDFQVHLCIGHRKSYFRKNDKLGKITKGKGFEKSNN